jgi:two-component system, OmpR family, phosphate regulon sensor histidine kinase PhoR
MSTPAKTEEAKSLFVTALTRVLLVAAIVGGIGALLHSVALGFALAAVVAFIAFAYHAKKLTELYQWLSGEHSAATVPEGTGTWGEVMTDLYRLIRESRTRETALITSLARFQEAANALPDGAVMLDIDNNIVWCNPTAELHWRISLANDRMQTITYFIRYPEFNNYLAARNFNEPLTLKLNRPLDGGGTEEATYTVQLVAFGDDQSLLLSRDISERDRLERMRTDFVANVSHELRTPLTVMSGFVETIQKVSTGGTDKPELIKRSLDHMMQQTERMQRLVDDLLALSRLEDNQNKLAETVIDMQALVQSSLSDARVLSAGKHQLHASLTPAWLMGNRDELASMVSNLVSNAVRYTPAGGEISVALSFDATTRDLIFSVRDNGEGIPPEHLPRLTERFYRVDRGRSRAAGGTGLGLAIVKHVLMRHGGYLTIASTQGTDDHGSTFTATLPAARAMSETPRLIAA